VASTTVGYEMRANWGLTITDEDEFVRMVLDGQPEPPRYFAQMKRINKEGPRILGGMPRAMRASALAFDDFRRAGAVIVDTRPAAEFAAGHLPATLNIPLNTSFTTWAGWLLPYDRDVVLLVDEGACPRCADSAIRDLAMIGLDRVAGVLGLDALAAWRAGGHVLQTVAQSTPTEVAAMVGRGDAIVIDVRGHTEWAAGHIPGAANVPVGYLAEQIAELPTDMPVIVQCQSGVRSAIAASVLAANGIPNVVNMSGGIVAWQQAGLPVTQEDAAAEAALAPAQ
jgi:hydroxyacylglutathione hydrolase